MRFSRARGALQAYLSSLRGCGAATQDFGGQRDASRIGDGSRGQLQGARRFAPAMQKAIRQAADSAEPRSPGKHGERCGAIGNGRSPVEIQSRISVQVVPNTFSSDWGDVICSGQVYRPRVVANCYILLCLPFFRQGVLDRVILSNSADL